ncbi:MAG: FAD-linked oxidase C-terminal domain-containing protein [Thermoguttaceae bacterium]|jgi:FAD/FMN-containing dehydrogenase/Fe-S oxidoreductase|nr:FAD-linked oxidase C-terminal domain-containing protein [Thermoguttaceae bacterium]
MEQHEAQRDIILDDLRGLVRGEVFVDPVHRQLYTSDGSIFEIRPLAVVRPRNTADVVACVQYAGEKGIPVHARGSGSGVAGESLGPGLVVDFSKFLRRVLYMEHERVRVQPGVIHERLNAQLHHAGRLFGPDPGNSQVTTIGSVLAVNAAGSRWPRYGAASDNVCSLQVVTAQGEVMEFGREPAGSQESGAGDSRKQALVGQLASLLSRHADAIRSSRPKSPMHRCGYNLEGVVDGEFVDLARLMCGSEGTLALITEATLRTEPLPRYRGVTLLLFDSMDKAARAVLEILPHRPSACDLMDRRHLSLARETEVRFDLLIPAQTEAVLLVEQEGSDPTETRGRLRRLVDELRDARHLAFDARQAFDPDDFELYWRLATKMQPALFQVRGPTRPVPVVEDIAVPPETLPEFLVHVQNVLKRQQVTASIFGHAVQGQLHVQPFFDVFNPSDVDRMRRLAEELYEEVFQVGGTISGEHGIGLARTAFLRRQAGSLYEVFREIKRVFDPKNLLNPGKVVGDDPDLLTRHVRRSIEPALAGPEDSNLPQMRDLVELQLDWHPSEVAAPAAECNRCGTCRTQAPDTRMCPLFRIAPSEEASPRAKVNLICGLLSGQLELGTLTSDQFKQVADLCYYCHSCRLECPAHVDIPRLVRESKGAYVAANGLSLTDWIMSRLDVIDAFASLVSPAANWAFSNRLMRWLGEKMLGIAQGRKLPRVTSRPYLRRAARRRLTRPSRRTENKIAYFVDIYANYHDPQLAEALVAVLEHNGVSVYVPPGQRQAGMSAIACGALDRARRLAKRNTIIFADAVRQGYHVVATEPAAALCLAREYPQLLDDEDSHLVSANSSEACTFLWRMHREGRLRLDFKPVHATLGYHTPCHLAALQVGTPGENLLRLIPGLRIHHIEDGCSGMAGAFGLQHRNYRTSLRAGWRLISRLRDPGLQAGTTECSACKVQMEQGTTKPTIHPIKVLALAYGLMPGVETLLKSPCKELTVT